MHEHESTRFTPALLAGKHFPDDTGEIYAAQKALSRPIIEMRRSMLGCMRNGFPSRIYRPDFFIIIGLRHKSFACS